MNNNLMQQNYIWLITSIVIKEVLVEFNLKSTLLTKFSNYLQKFKITFYRNVNFVNSLVNPNLTICDMPIFWPIVWEIATNS